MIQTATIQRGRTWTSIPESTVLGRPMFFPSMAVSSDNPMMRNRTGGGGVIGALFQNDSGATLQGKRLVTWDTAQILKEITGYAFGLSDWVACVIDDLLPASGVADDAYFVGLFKGKVTCYSPATAGAFGDNTIAIGDMLGPGVGTTKTNADAGRVRQLAPATQQVRVAGAAAGNVTITGIALADRLVSVLHHTTGGAIADLTSEFSITAANTINNTGGTATDSDSLIVTYERNVSPIGRSLEAVTAVDTDVDVLLDLPFAN